MNASFHGWRRRGASSSQTKRACSLEDDRRESAAGLLEGKPCGVCLGLLSILIWGLGSSRAGSTRDRVGTQGDSQTGPQRTAPQSCVGLGCCALVHEYLGGSGGRYQRSPYDFSLPLLNRERRPLCPQPARACSDC